MVIFVGFAPACIQYIRIRIYLYHFSLYTYVSVTLGKNKEYLYHCRLDVKL